MGVFLKVLHQRADFYSACVYLSQNSANLMVNSDWSVHQVVSLSAEQLGFSHFKISQKRRQQSSSHVLLLIPIQGHHLVFLIAIGDYDEVYIILEQLAWCFPSHP